MSETVISVTEAARNFSDCVNRSHYQNTTFLLLKNGVPFVRLVPAGMPVCRGSDLAAALAAASLSAEDARAWNRDRKAARKKLKPPADRWQ
jgi:hypothetical protein